MVRVVIPPGFTWDVQDGQPIEGPWEMVIDHIQLPLVAGEPKEVVNTGEYILHTDGTFYQSMAFTREETSIVTPLTFAMLALLVISWFRKSLLPILILSPFLVQAATYQLDAKTGVSISWPTGMSGSSLSGWKINVATGAVLTGSTPTVTGSVGGKPSMISTPLMVESWDWYYVITTGGSGAYTTRTKLKWFNPYQVGTSEPTDSKGNFDGSGNPTLEDGTPVVDPSNPVPTTPVPSKANGDFSNPFGSPATPILTIRPKDGSPPQNIRWPQLQPGQKMPWDFEFPGSFDWEVGWDLGDGVFVPDPGSGNTGTSTPLPGGSPTPPSGGDGSNGAITTPPITPPADAPAGDVAAAVNRHAAMTQAYGEAARTAAGITNNNLDSLESLFGKALDKLSSIDGKTGTGTGMDGVTIEGDALVALENIDAATAGTVTAPTFEALANPPGFDTIGTDHKTSDVTGIRADMHAMGTALGNVVSSLGLGPTHGIAPIAYSFTVFGHGYTVNFEIFGWVFDLIRSFLLGLLSLRFVWRLLAIVRGALVG